MHDLYRDRTDLNPEDILIAARDSLAVYTGLCLPFAVLEFKSCDPGAALPSFPGDLCLRPAKVSKFLWSTGGGR